MFFLPPQGSATPSQSTLEHFHSQSGGDWNLPVQKESNVCEGREPPGMWQLYDVPRVAALPGITAAFYFFSLNVLGSSCRSERFTSSLHEGAHQQEGPLFSPSDTKPAAVKEYKVGFTPRGFCIQFCFISASHSFRWSVYFKFASRKSKHSPVNSWCGSRVEN